MTPKNKLQFWQKRKASAELHILKIQQECPHPSETLFGRYMSSTGNWCSQDDCYWLDLDCELCGKCWSVDSDKPGYTTTKFTERK